MKEFLVYLAGPITGTSFGECTDWREYVKSKFPPEIIALSPMRGKTYLSHEKSISHSYEQMPLSSGKGINARDFNDVMRCDLVFVNFIGATKVSIGTVLEIGWAKPLLKPVVLAMEEGNIHEHCMIENSAGFIVPDLDQAIEIAKSVLLP